jgi:hypothetical protein
VQGIIKGPKNIQLWTWRWSLICVRLSWGKQRIPVELKACKWACWFRHTPQAFTSIFGEIIVIWQLTQYFSQQLKVGVWDFHRSTGCIFTKLSSIRCWFHTSMHWFFSLLFFLKEADLRLIYWHEYLSMTLQHFIHLRVHKSARKMSRKTEVFFLLKYLVKVIVWSFRWYLQVKYTDEHISR